MLVGRYILWIEYGETMGSSKDKCTIFQLAGSTIIELETTNAIGFFV